MLLTMYSENINRHLAMIPIAGDFTVLKGKSSQPHIHKVYHIIFITRGNGSLEKDGSTLSLRETDIILINPQEKHIFKTADEIEYFSFNFYLLDLQYISSISQLGRNLSNIEYFEAHGITEPYETLFPVGLADGKLIYGEGIWREMLLFAAQVDDYFTAFARRAPVTQESLLEIQKRIINFSVQRLMQINDLIANHSDGLSQKERRLVKAITDYLSEDISRSFSLGELAARLSYSPVYLSRFFREKTGFTISGYLDQLRIGKGCEYLKGEDFTIMRIAELLGYSSPNHFGKNFKRQMGLSPGEYRRASS
ncbi:MAG: AraC family transcriptional regulator [Christensenellales bacterium]|jgi:AraC-like DNA-binding protein